MTHEVDVLIVGAGLSGINTAYRLQEANPDLTYTIVERRDSLGGTWDLFRYPGIRSDSDIYTLAFPWSPWTGKNSIVDGPEIWQYLTDTARRFGIDKHINYGVKVTAADFDGEEGKWHVTTENGETYIAGWVAFTTGYYDYDKPYDAKITGIDTFGGEVVHPQFWPEDLDYQGKKIIVIGSGATAVTLVPSLGKQGAGHVTMLQRTPSYIMPAPRVDEAAIALRKYLPAKNAHLVSRARHNVLGWAIYNACLKWPDKMRGFIRKTQLSVMEGVPNAEQIIDEHFTPDYNPWEQRLCASPDGDFFTEMRKGDIDIVTGHIDTVTPTGIKLTDGRELEADIIVTATGLDLQIAGGTQLSVDGKPFNAGESYIWNGALLSDLPNASICLGYINASWTLRSDMTSRLVAKVIDRAFHGSKQVVTPRVPGNMGPSEPAFYLNAGYIARAADKLPKATQKYPWALKPNYLLDSWNTNRADLDEGLEWRSVRQPAHV